MKKSAPNLEFDVAAVEDLAWWVEKDRKKALRNLRLKNQLTGCWSHRIDDEHRIVYQVQESKVRILACRYHYD